MTSNHLNLLGYDIERLMYQNMQTKKNLKGLLLTTLAVPNTGPKSQNHVLFASGAQVRVPLLLMPLYLLPD
jgi:hypothetical protein